MMREMKKSKGFTMIELLVVATIMIVLTTVGLVSFQKTTRNSRNAKRKAALETVRQSLVLYRSDLGSYPSGGGTASAFNAMLIIITDYVSTANVTDPQNTDEFVYTYTSNGSTFSVCGYLDIDPAPIQYCLTNP